MEQAIRIGLLQYSVCWESILEQIGVAYGIVGPINEEKHAVIRPLSLVSRFSLLVVNRPLTNSEIDIVEEYVKNGGALVDSGGFCIQCFFGGTLYAKKVSSLIGESVPFFPHPFIIDIFGKVQCFSKGCYADNTLFIEQYGCGCVAFLGIDPESLLCDIRSRRKQFFAPAPRYPHEEVSAVSKGTIVDLLFSLMRYMHIIRNMPFVHKWFFPSKEHSVFLFRIDSDYGTKKQIQRWHTLLQKHTVRTTWFLHVAAHRSWLDLFCGFDGDEIAVHGFEHFTSAKAYQLENNIMTAKRMLEEKKLKITGYAAPYGLWNSTLDMLCNRIGFTYSSEFAYCYDSWPLYPVINNRRSSVLQIPIHPICIGSLLHARAHEKQIVEYFIAQSKEKQKRLLPLVFYDHVVHDSLTALDEFLAGIDLRTMLSLTFADYALWWQLRERVSFSASADSLERVAITSPNSTDACALCVWNSNTSYILTSPDPEIMIRDHAEQTLQSPPTLSKTELRNIRRFDWRLYKQTLLTKLFWRHYS